MKHCKEWDCRWDKPSTNWCGISSIHSMNPSFSDFRHPINIAPSCPRQWLSAATGVWTPQLAAVTPRVFLRRFDNEELTEHRLKESLKIKIHP